MLLMFLFHQSFCYRYLQLLQHLDGTPFAERLISAERLVASVRGQKSVRELTHIERAVAETQSIFSQLVDVVQVGFSEAEIAAWMQQQARSRGLGLAWDPHACPIVNCGPDSMVGHGVPSPELKLAPGHVLHVAFGVVYEGYCSDLQRCWYVLSTGEARPPEPLEHAFDTVVRAIQAAAETMRPGVRKELEQVKR